MSGAQDLEILLRYFRIEQRDLDALARLREPFERRAETLIQAFFQHLAEFPDTKGLLANVNVRQRLFEAQRDYLLSLTDPVIDEAYVEQRARIGQAHERAGLGSRWYLGAYSLYFGLLAPVIREALDDDPKALDETVSALEKRLLFDAQISIRQYIQRREFELRKLNDQLRAEGRSLTLEVEETHQDLRRTEARAHEAEQLAAVATLISGLAHEIGTPMGVIRGHAEALGGAVEGERATWRLNMILEQIDRITGIIHALLNMARPRESLRTTVDLEASLEATLAFLTEKLRRRGVEVDRSVTRVPNIVADPEKLQQVFLNLMINAVDSMPDGGKLGIGLGLEGSETVVRIADTGGGITKDQIEHIFDPFYTTKPAGRGSGLGLVVVKGIVDEHGGAINVASRPGKGTEFTVRFPGDPGL
ncbi:MAG: hypothetical protein GY944_16540 [bacterium]|nr:hypothetical protein [bacterium]